MVNLLFSSFILAFSAGLAVMFDLPYADYLSIAALTMACASVLAMIDDTD